MTAHARARSNRTFLSNSMPRLWGTFTGKNPLDMLTIKIIFFFYPRMKYRRNTPSTPARRNYCYRGGTNYPSVKPCEFVRIIDFREHIADCIVVGFRYNAPVPNRLRTAARSARIGNTVESPYWNNRHACRLNSSLSKDNTSTEL